MKKVKKVVSILCAVSMILALSVTAFAAETPEMTGIEPLLPSGAELPRVVGYEFSVGSLWRKLDLSVPEDVKEFKIWVHCSTGEVDVEIVDDNGDSVRHLQTLKSTDEQDYYFEDWITRKDAYTGSYYLRMRSHDSRTATGWYNWRDFTY